MTDYIKAYANPTSPYNREARKIYDDFCGPETSLEDGVLRWTSNGRVPPADVIEFAAAMVAGVDEAACTAARESELAAFVAEYRATQPATPSAEERAEARAAHGPGVKLVDVLSGREFVT